MTEHDEPGTGVRPLIRCELVFATESRQVLLPLQVEEGTTALQLVAQSQISREFPDHDFSSPELGVFSRPVESDYVVKDGDRIEIYRPLLADPKEVRRKLASLGRSMGDREVPDEEY